jgi:hypothetical protein
LVSLVHIALLCLAADPFQQETGAALEIDVATGEEGNRFAVG